MVEFELAPGVDNASSAILQPDKSRDASDWQLENMWSTEAQSGISQPERLRDLSEVQLANIE